MHYEHEFDFKEALKQHDEGKGSLDEVTEVGQLKSISQRSLLSARAFQRTSFLVVSASWLEAASELQACDEHVRVGVLNSASGTTPGGRFLKGTVSQEDCLCRASLLYSCISQPKFQSEGRFYGKNRSFRYGSSNCVIFSPDVPVIREDTVEGKLLDRYKKVSFVSVSLQADKKLWFELNQMISHCFSLYLHHVSCSFQLLMPSRRALQLVRNTTILKVKIEKRAYLMHVI